MDKSQSIADTFDRKEMKKYNNKLGNAILFLEKSKMTWNVFFSSNLKAKILKARRKIGLFNEFEFPLFKKSL